MSEPDESADRPVALPTHPLLRQLWHVIEHKRVEGQLTSPELLDLFWAEVETLGTPLMVDVDGTTRATFVFAEKVENMIDAVRAYEQVTVAWSGSRTGEYRTSLLPLSLLPRSNVWWAEVDLPPAFTGMYHFWIHNQEGLIVEDVHERWAMSFGDPFNEAITHEADSGYDRRLVTTKTYDAMAREGATDVIEIAATRVPLPGNSTNRYRDPQADDPETIPVWRYAPHPVHISAAEVPLVLLMAGQFHEAINVEAQLDRAISSGRTPPVRIWSPGRRRSGFTAWGWRNGFGPGSLSAFVRDDLLSVASASSLNPVPLHLLGWAYSAFSAVETAIRMPGRVSSVILIDPSTMRPDSVDPVFMRGRDRDRWNIGAAFKRLSETTPGVIIAIGKPPERGNSPFAWTDDHAKFVAAARAAGLETRTFEVSDPNIVAEGEAIPAGIAAATLHSG